MQKESADVWYKNKAVIELQYVFIIFIYEPVEETA